LLTSELTFIYEANVSQDKLIRYDNEWAEEIGLGEIKTLTGILELMCDKYIDPQYIELFLEKQSPKSILATFKLDKHVVTFDINMRVYILNIDKKKKNDIKSAADRKRYELALSKSVIIYELNITKDIMNYLHEEIGNRFDLFSGEDFTKNVLPLILKSIHPHDHDKVAELLSTINLLEAYSRGENDLGCEYRRIDKEGKYNWFRCSLQLFEDIQNKDIICYAYVEDINKEKGKEIALIYKAQHDLMTGFYNKNSTEEKINEIIFSDDGKTEKHILFIIDLDNFKLVNDKFGHAFGDAVLSQTSAKIGSLFRTGDILGRIGGDEFIVFMRNVQNEKIAHLKAKEICENASEMYVQNDIEYKVTVSVGIAFYNKHGNCFDELYRHSDMAWYDAKENGRNRFSVYNEDMQFKHSAVKGIDPRQVVEINTFESNVSDYLFRILYESKDKSQAIKSVLELIGKHYHVSRAYVFENSEDGRYAKNTFEWCNKGVSTQIEKTTLISYDEIKDYAKNFNNEGIFYVADSRELQSPLKEIVMKQGIKSVVQFSMLENGKFAGFIGFDECTCYRVPESKELNDYRNFANILGVFIAEMRSVEKLEASKNLVLSVVDGLDSYAYVCDPSEHKILFANIKAIELSP
ncbi:MAG: sensor domain-containing diguanylate cyclase, partial [Oscillospiraceae bacterium]